MKPEMKKTLSRKKARIVIAALFVGFAFVLAGSLLQNLYCYSVGVAVLLNAVVLRFRWNKCPYCGKTVKGMNWSKRDLGYCPNCQKWLEYDK